MTNLSVLLPLKEECQETVEKLLAINPSHHYKFFNLLGHKGEEVEIREATIQAKFLEEIPLGQRLTPEQEVLMYRRFLCDLKDALKLAQYLEQFK
jgi:hypothetical protein